MTRVIKAGIATAALTIATGFALPATAADLGGYGRGGSVKDGYVAPMPEVHRGAAGPCYFRADVGYSLSGDPDAKWPVNNITRTWDTDPSAGGYTSHHDAGYGGTVTGETYTYVGDAVSSASIENTWLAEAGIGCGSGSRGFRAEVMLGYRGDRKFQGEPEYFEITNLYPVDPNEVDAVTDDPMHTSLRTYTMMMNVYKDLGSFNGFTPYVGAGIGAAYHMMSEVYFTDNPNLTNRISGNNDLSFAWSLMAGVGYQVSERAILDFGYRYIDLGKATSGRVDNAGFVNPRVNIDDITAHEFKVGLRYHFGQADCCGAPAYAPMK